MREKSIVKPSLLKDIKVKRAFYLPFDRPGSSIWKELKKNASKKKELGYGVLFYLPQALVLCQSVGAPAAIIGLEQLTVSGLSEVVLLGWCGALNRNRKIGEAVSIYQAYSNEGTSSHYFPRKKVFYPDKLLKKRLEQKLISLGLSFTEGNLVSTDAPYRETPSWILRQKEKNIGFVDMEASAVFAWAKFRHIKAAALMIVSDLVEPNCWTPGFGNRYFTSQVKNYFLPLLFTENPF